MAGRQLNVWVVDDDQSVRWVLEKALRQADMEGRTFERAEHLLEAIEHGQPDVLITDVRMPGMSGIALLERLRTSCPELPIIIITAHSDLENAVAAYKGGAFEYLPKPFDIDEAMELVRKAARQNGQAASGEQQSTQGIRSLIGQAPAMQEVFRSIGRLAGSSMTVLITGESGTGKELVAQALHEHSPRANKPFVALNTSAIAAELLESELFGHEKGAFTGADARRIGRFEQADGGTLFLDEIGDMSPALQTRLLRVLAESEFYRVGGQSSIKVDVRVIAATNQDLARAVKESRFREDLYHRLNVIRINSPPLRQRRADIPLLLNHYLVESAKELDAPAKSIDADALDVLQDYDWPGNVRQLVNATRRLTVTAPGTVITNEDIPADLGGSVTSQRAAQEWTRSLATWAEKQLSVQDGGPLLDTALPEFEKTLIQIAMSQTNGHRQEAAKLLGWGRNTLARKMKSLHMD
ncbi:MAG: nitrogen regulation protein NR(I) [Gammaproteobacteria bacterium]|jgi:two-component system nitrogen regulation response regulator GlnG|nr:nitrogen regulation protein NR(I) [Gammaproteobacteria bacterium]MDH3749204.1 nitrogen regulation protein NR(I) [Gammaproteobacteria bacterium]MDH3804045.1 nitrogen regulation protein NR(I) [Gammaproteobacteria bacterium]